MSKYKNQVQIVVTDDNKQYYTTGIPSDPVQQDIEYIYTARIGDRWDTLAYKYLGTPTLWYVIANANGMLDGSIFIKPGTQVILPEKY